MTVLAHITFVEAFAVVAVFLAGFCAGLIVARSRSAKTHNARS
jgi:hypothetical protein